MNIVNIFNQVLIVFSGIVSLSYFNSLYKRNKSFIFTLSAFFISYVLLAFLYLLKLPTLNLTMYVIVNIVLAKLCFNSTLSSSLCNGLILTVLMMASEFLFLLLSQSIFGKSMVTNINDINSVLFQSVGSKFLFMLMIWFLKIILAFIKNDYNSKEIIYFLIIPVATGILLFFTQSIIDKLSSTEILLLFIAITIIIFANLFCFLLYDSILKKNQTVLLLKESVHKNELAFKNYQILEERYNTAKIIEHDINKHLTVLKSLLEENDTQATIYLDNLIEAKKQKSNLVNLTDNKIFNIIVNEKLEKCKALNINFEYDIQYSKLNFLEDTDTVSIFSNLLDNALESCQISENKNISLSIYPVNSSFLTIKLSNSCDKKPITKNNDFITSKKDKKTHGFGIKSVKNCLTKYNGSFTYDYDEKNKIFTIIIILALS